MSKILLVEDNEMNRDMLSRRLERKGFDVVMAVDGQAGIGLAGVGRKCEYILLSVNGKSCGIRDLHMNVGERQVLVAFLPFTDKYPSNSLG